MGPQVLHQARYCLCRALDQSDAGFGLGRSGKLLLHGLNQPVFNLAQRSRCDFEETSELDVRAREAFGDIGGDRSSSTARLVLEIEVSCDRWVVAEAPQFSAQVTRQLPGNQFLEAFRHAPKRKQGPCRYPLVRISKDNVIANRRFPSVQGLLRAAIISSSHLRRRCSRPTKPLAAAHAL